MGVTAAVQRGRFLAEQQMLDECIVRRLTGTTVDPETAVETPTWVVLYEGRAKCQTYEGYESNTDGGGHQFTQQRYAAHFPVGAFKPEVGDVVEWTACRLDPDLLGTKDRITALFNKSFATAMRVSVDRGVA